MKSLYSTITSSIPKLNSCKHISAKRTRLPLDFWVQLQPIPAKTAHFRSHTPPRPQSSSNPETQVDEEDQVQDLIVPQRYLVPSKALEESEWLRLTLHKWLDDEYCPEPTNVEISNIAAQSYYKSLLDKQTDLGEILLKMAMELESISYQESFHVAFTSANAAINLIAQRIEQQEA